MERKNPITINEPFTCENCGTKVSKAASGCRNHCNECLWSRHVDENVPGDRTSQCGGMMEPVAIQTNKKGDQQVLHECRKCGQKQASKVMPDDNRDMIIKTMQRQNIEPLEHET